MNIDNLDSFISELKICYVKIQNGDLNIPQKFISSGFKKEYLVKPELMIELLRTEKDEIKKNITGVGAEEYITKKQLLYRCTIRLSAAVYMWLGVEFPEGAYDYYESITQMEEGDAKEWLSRALL